MKKLFTIRLHLNVFVLCILSLVKSALQEENDLNFEPLILEVTRTSLDGYVLKNISLLTKDGILRRATKPNQNLEKEKYVFACPKKEEELNKLTQKWSAPQFGNIQNCLFEEKFSEEKNKRCASPLSPELTPSLDYTNKRTRCSNEEKHFLHTFGFKFCQSLEDYIEKNSSIFRRLRNFHSHEVDPDVKPTLYEMYFICYDPNEHTIFYTRHTIMAPTLIENVSVTEDAALSTESFESTNKEYYLNMQNAYNAQKQDANPWGYMVPQTLVPKEDLARPSWQSSALHFINSAPLSTKLTPLMNIINSTLRKVASRLKKRTGRDIEIFTKVFNLSSSSVPLYLDVENKRFRIPDIWCKLVRSRVTPESYESILIFVHNNTMGDPTTIQNQCERPAQCNFGKWSENTLSEELTKHAYCCKVTQTLMKTYFSKSIDKDVENELNLEEWLRDFQPLPVIAQTNTNLSFPFYSQIDFAEDVELEDVASLHTEQYTPKLLYLCPAENDIIEAIDKLHLSYEPTCLYAQTFKSEGPKMCENPVKPKLHMITNFDEEPILHCPNQTEEFLYQFRYQDIPNLFIKSYAVCYDKTNGGTTLTIHNIKFKSRILDANYTRMNEEINYEKLIFGEDNTFMLLPHIYKTTKEWVAHPMVPREDMSSKHWRSITWHYINTSALRYELSPLMRVIEERIRKLANQIQPVTIYTRTFNFENSLESIQYKSAKVYILEYWCKLVIVDNKSEYAGVAIYIKNTKPEPHNMLCERQMECNIKLWHEESSMSQANIENNLFQYAYCCALDNYTMNLFPLKQSITEHKYINLNSFDIERIDKPNQG